MSYKYFLYTNSEKSTFDQIAQTNKIIFKKAEKRGEFNDDLLKRVTMATI